MRYKVGYLTAAVCLSAISGALLTTVDAQVPPVGPERCVGNCESERRERPPRPPREDSPPNRPPRRAEPSTPRNVVEEPPGTYRPAFGYRWRNTTRGDFSVELIPRGTPGDYPNTVWGGDGLLYPGEGYGWEDPNNPSGTFRVRALPAGTRHARYPNVVWVGDGVLVVPARGYHWENRANPSANRFRVLPDAGTPHPTYPNVVGGSDGGWAPAEGYRWATSDPTSLSVKPLLRGTPHERYSNVVWNGDGRSFRPKEGFWWQTPHEPAAAGYRVAPAPEGTAHPRFLNVVWVGDGMYFRPSPGYQWTNPQQPSAAFFRVEPIPGYVDDLVKAGRWLADIVIMDSVRTLSSDEAEFVSKAIAALDIGLTVTLTAATLGEFAVEKAILKIGSRELALGELKAALAVKGGDAAALKVAARIQDEAEAGKALGAHLRRLFGPADSLPRPPGVGLNEFMQQTLKLGTGYETPHRLAQSLTAAELRKNGVTRQIAEVWSDVYSEAARFRRGQPADSFLGRSEYFQRAAELLRAN